MENTEYENKLNNFWEMHKQERFSPIELVLYYALLDMKYRIKTCIVTNDYLCQKLGISEIDLVSARMKLKTRNLINYNLEEENIQYFL